MTETLPPYVSEASTSEVVVEITDAVLRHEIQSWGKHRGDAGKIVIDVASDHEKATLFGRLRDHGVAFAVGRGWSPSEVFDELRAIGLVTGSFHEIYWTGPGAWSVRGNG
jgi:hypothetical protein